MRRATLAVIGVSAALFAAGCGGDDEEEPAGGGATPTETATPEDGGTEQVDGRELFVQTCSGCHTLADAGTNGQVGPNLDDLAPDTEQVRQAIASGPGAMPENLLEGAEADAVADYVASAAGG